MVHAAIYAALFVPLSVGGGLFAAVALNRRIRGIRFYRLAVFVPVVVSTIATSIMFLWLFDPNFGLANWLLGKVGLGPFGFFTSSNGALYSIIVDDRVGVDRLRRHHLPGRAARGSAGAARGGRDRRGADVEHLPQRHAAAARARDAVPRRVLLDQRAPGVRRGVLPDKGGPGTATYVPVLYLYKLAFEQGIAGYAAAIAYVLLIAILILTVIQLWVGKRMVYYAS